MKERRSIQYAFIGLLALLLAWLPILRELDGPSADQLFDLAQIINRCSSRPPLVVTGWMGDQGLSIGAGALFAPSLLGRSLQMSACELSRMLSIPELKAYLFISLLLTWVLAWVACRWLGYRALTASLVAFLISTAPSSFSRVGHIGLSPLIPVVPTLLACLLIERSMLCQVKPVRLFAVGGLAALLTFPSQEYYVAFSLIIVTSSFFLCLLLRSAQSLEFDFLLPVFMRGLSVLAGFLFVIAVCFLPKMIEVGGGVLPAAWTSPRLAIEQFRYGLLPFTWFIPSVWVPLALKGLQGAGIPSVTESYLSSTGSLLIPISWICAIRRLSQSPLNRQHLHQYLADLDRRFLALLLLLVSAIGLVFMTMGGLGTLFAAFVSPLLRSLNRFTVFVYGAAVLYMAAEFDLWLRRNDDYV